MENLVLTYILYISLQLKDASANSSHVQITKVLTTGVPVEPETVPSIVMTIALIAGCVIFGMIVAKITDLIYDRHVRKFMRSKKETSDQALKMLKARAAIMR
ncbi:hypothetical protein EB796_020986 [Bugula neritina]|uniref:Uncharacterized protein n=1 Tax=Bugula neritina TaxID=10212 RepID=A0A7J7J503_BUGNE|nr:hypothetical protein EB796_020986 [Bugula neritina]